MLDPDIHTLAVTIIWLAQERMKEHKYQNINSAVHSVTLDIEQELMEFMALHKL